MSIEPSFRALATWGTRRPIYLIEGIHVDEFAAVATGFALRRKITFLNRAHPDVYVLRNAHRTDSPCEDGVNLNHMFATSEQAADPEAGALVRSARARATEQDLADAARIDAFVAHARSTGGLVVSLHSMGFPAEYRARVYAGHVLSPVLRGVDGLEVARGGFAKKGGVERVWWGSLPTYYDGAIDWEVHGDRYSREESRANADFLWSTILDVV